MSGNNNDGNGTNGGIKRIRQACVNCRRKKVRCSGERPICSFCRRLSQNCSYNEEPTVPPADNNTSTVHPHGDAGMVSRIAALEAQLKNITEEIQNVKTILPERSSITTDRLVPAESLASIHQGGQSTVHRGSSSQGSSAPPTGDTTRFRSLPPRPTQIAVVDEYFSSCENQPYSIFHEQSFRQRLDNNGVPEYLLFVILATGLRYSSISFFQGYQSDAIEQYTFQSWQSIVDRWHQLDEETDLDLVRAMLLHSVIDFKGGKHHHAWVKIGLCIRVSQDLGLMEEPDPNLKTIEKEERRRLFWSIYSLDKFVSCNRRRPAGILDEDCGVHLPCRQSDFEAGKNVPTQALEDISVTLPLNAGTFALAVVGSSLLAKTARYCLSKRGQVSQIVPWDPTSMFASISSKLDVFESRYEIGSSFADAITGAEFMMNGLINNQRAGHLILVHGLLHLSQCLLNHPVLLLRRPEIINGNGHGRRKFLRRAFDSARENAVALSMLMSDAKAAGCTLRMNMFAYCLTVSSTIHILNLQSTDSHVQKSSSEMLESNKRLLRDLSVYWRNASMMLESLRGFQAYAICYPNLFDLSINSKVQKIDVAGLDDLLDYSVLSTRIVNVGTSEEPLDSASVPDWTPLPWMDFVLGEPDLMSLPTPAGSPSCTVQPSNMIQPSLATPDTTASSSDSTFGLSPLSLFLMSQSST